MRTYTIMKNVKYIFAIALLSLLMVQCDKIEEPYLKNPPEPVKRNALLEVFSGHLSAESPAMLDKVKALKEKYGADLDVIVYHAGDMAAVQDEIYTADLSTEVGNKIYADFNAEAAQGMVARSGISAQNGWDAAIGAVITDDSEVKLSLTETFDIENRALNVTVKCDVESSVSEDIKIATYLVEEDLVANQKFPDMDSLGYVNINVFRASLDDAYGAFVIAEPKKESYSNEYETFVVNAQWRADKLRIITIAYTGEALNPNIIQVESKHVNTDPEPERVKKVLLEEFTGHTCSNCPRAHKEIARLKEKYGDQIAALAYHAGGFAIPGGVQFPEDFRTDAGNVLHDYYGVESYPIGIVGRSELAFYTDWESQIAAALAQAPDAVIQISQEYDAASRNLTVDVNSTILTNNIGGGVLLAVHLAEHHIIGAQADGSEIVPDYEHMDMFRAAMSSTGGEGGPFGEVLAESVNANEKYSKSFSLTLSEEWNPENMSIVAFLMNADDFSVIQVEEVHLH